MPGCLYCGGVKLRRRLYSEVWRHSAVGVAILVLVLVAQTGYMIATDTAALQDSELYAVVLGAVGLYGPAYLLLSRYVWRGLRGESLRSTLRDTRPSRLARRTLVSGPVGWALMATLLPLAAVAALAGSAQLTSEPYLIVASLVCVSGSWVMLVGSFAIEYAREWASSSGFRFPDDDDQRRTYGDFIYTAVQVSTTYSSSDVAVMNQRARRLVTVNSATAFAFSTVIIALAVALVLSGVIT